MSATPLSLSPAARAVRLEGSDPSAAAVVAMLGKNARAAQRRIAQASADRKRAALNAMASRVRSAADTILAANAADLGAMTAEPAFVDRARLDPARLDGIAEAISAIAKLDDPVGRVLDGWERPNGLRIERVAVPLGVIGVIYESRPNVTADAAALCLMAGNAVILRSGSQTLKTAMAIAEALREGLEDAGMTADAIQLVPIPDREAVGAMLAGADGGIDVIVPRGGRSLVERVEREARVPVFAHLDGVCHVYVHEGADAEMAVEIAVNAKMRRTGICGAAETLLVDRAIADRMVPALVAALTEKGCTVRGDEAAARLAPMERASEDDWSTEYLAPIITLGLVDGVDAAMDHIARYGSHHTDCIVTDDQAAAERFLSEVDSAIVLHNASTQFADGGEFGMGAEIGIATGRLHARGPVGVAQLTTFNYRVHGAGQVRP